MEQPPENTSRPKNKKFRYIAAAAVFLMLTALAVFLMVNLVIEHQGNSGKKEISAAPQPGKKPGAAKNPQPQNTPADAAAKEKEEFDEEKAKSDAEINKVIEEINKRAAQKNQPQGESNDVKDKNKKKEQNGVVTEEVVEEKEIQTAGQPPTPAPQKDNKITDRRRYLMVALYDLTGGADIAVTDSYTGETRLFEDVAGKKKIISFEEKPVPSAAHKGLKKNIPGQPDPKDSSLRKLPGSNSKKQSPTGALRYTPLVFHNSGKIEGAVVDEYTGEMRKLTGLIPGRPLNPFKDNRKTGAGELRYNVLTEFVAGDIILYFIDTFTGRVRAETVQELPGALNLFTGPRDPVAGSRRYFSWTNYGGDILTHCFCIDAYTSEIKMLPDIRRKKAVTFFETNRDRGALRYEGWSLYRHGHIQFFVIDTFTSEIKMSSLIEFEEPLKLFDNKDDTLTDRHRRYTAGVGFLPNGAMITYAVDTFSGEIKIKTGDPGSLPGPARYFTAPKEAGVPRYQVSVFFQYESGVDVYQMDTFSGEIRIKTNVAGTQTLKLFQGAPHPF
ncbi:MAG: hypothetical protein KAW12_10895 [Candidatus Aminicenantes bacterium]|nr:hypothetical protein [Candidatus Aminicenantes bacterium]